MPFLASNRGRGPITRFYARARARFLDYLSFYEDVIYTTIWLIGTSACLCFFARPAGARTGH